jgi:hypothetical protein
MASVVEFVLDRLVRVVDGDECVSSWIVYSVVGCNVDHRAVIEGFSSASELMAMTTDSDWGLDVVYEAPDGL